MKAFNENDQITRKPRQRQPRNDLNEAVPAQKLHLCLLKMVERSSIKSQDTASKILTEKLSSVIKLTRNFKHASNLPKQKFHTGKCAEYNESRLKMRCF